MNKPEVAAAPRLTDEVTDVLYDAALRVATRCDFARFSERLAEDFETNRAVWENLSIPEFLLALANCTRRSSSGPHLAASSTSTAAHFADEDLSWSLMGRLLLGASVMR